MFENYIDFVILLIIQCDTANNTKKARIKNGITEFIKIIVHKLVDKLLFLQTHSKDFFGKIHDFQIKNRKNFCQEIV